MTLLGGLAIVTAPSARAATAIEAKTPVDDALAAVLPAAPFHKTRSVHVGLVLAPVTYHFAAILSATALHRGHIIWF